MAVLRRADHSAAHLPRARSVGRLIQHASMRPSTSSALALAVIFLVSGCGDNGGATAGGGSLAPASSPTYATESQVASVVAGVEDSLRNTAEEAAECRITYVMGDTTNPIDRSEMMTCHTNEITAGQEAERAATDLATLEIPPALTDLVAETERALDAIADVDIERACGAPMRIPRSNDSCSTAHAERMAAYGDITTILDRWKPYL